MASERAGRIFAHQGAHGVALAVLIAGLWGASHLEGFREGSRYGVSTSTWTWLAVANAVVHQVYVWLCWRVELYGQGMTRRFGSAAFPLYAAGFTVLIAARPVLITELALSNAGTVAMSQALANTLAAACLVPAVWTHYSVTRYFGFRRAFGVDHFDPSYRSAPLVTGGIFRYTSNAMYLFGFLLLWIPGLLTRSLAALGVAAFSHLYIWVHYLVTEKPDMIAIYGGERDAT